MDPIQPTAPEQFANDALILAGIAIPFIDNAIARAVLLLAAKYGVEIIPRIEAVFAKKELTVEDIKSLFGELHTYEDFGIPETPPSSPPPAIADPVSDEPVPAPTPEPEESPT